MNDLDIIIPVRNEAGSVDELVARIVKSFAGKNINYGIIFIDDYSSDGTPERIREVAQKYSSSGKNTGNTGDVYRSQKTESDLKIVVLPKKGKTGKAYSILEGARESTATYLAMIDGDLQYPPEALPLMYDLSGEHGVVVANRKSHRTTLLRKVGSKVNVILFERLLHGFKVDTQSGLKVFRKEVIEHLTERDVSGWTIDMPLLATALELGYSIGCVDIDFIERKAGQSKVNFLKTGFEIGLGSLKLKFRSKKIYPIKSLNPNSPLGAGVAHRGKRFITHTHLPHESSAFHTFVSWQKLMILGLIATISAGLLINAISTAIIMVAVLTLIYFLDFLFNLYVLLKSLHFPPELKVTEAEIADLKDGELPIYTILCPLYREARILPHFVEAIDALDWPKNKLDVILLLEADDTDTISAANDLNLPEFVRVLVVPHSQPKTKPKACNYGLANAIGEYVVIYDAEDRPDPLQLKKAYLGFAKSPSNMVCLQSKLNYYNPHQNLLTRLFTAEYSLWFDLILPGLQAAEATIPLGGTSNHFKTDKLRELYGWDPFNVTEDCDLGTRLFRQGYKTGILDSVTLEEANSKLKGWIRQRSRWIKGYFQTYLVHTRNPIDFIKKHGIQAFVFQLVIGMRMVFILINPILWLATISYFAFYPIVGPTIESLYPGPVFYIAVFSLVFGNFMHLYNYMIGASKRRAWSIVKYIYLVPFYWAMTSIAAGVALYQLFTKPHYWEKTEHGVHLDRAEKEKLREDKRMAAESARRQQIQTVRGWARSGFIGGGVLVLSSVFANFFGFLYNAYLGRALSIEDFGILSLISSFVYIAQVPFGAMSKTVTHRSAYLLGKFNTPRKEFWSFLRERVFAVSAITMLLWILLIPFLVHFFKSETVLPFILFSPVWILGLVSAVDGGFIGGNLKFYAAAFLLVLEAVIKFLVTIMLVNLGVSQWVYAAIPLSMAISLLSGWFLISRMHSGTVLKEVELLHHFPKKFFITSALTKLSSVAFLSMDIILAKHFLPAKEAGEYALLSLVGKIVYFLGTQFGQFINPLVSKAEGAGRPSNRVFINLLAAVTFSSFLGFLGVGVFGSISVPILFGAKSNQILDLLPYYTAGIASFTIASTIVTYHQIKKEYLFPLASFLISVFQVVSIIYWHSSVEVVALITGLFGYIHLCSILVLHKSYSLITDLSNAFKTVFINLLYEQTKEEEKLKILIFNWRDTKHKWAGGAEVYVHEMAKIWAKEGNKVTLFCGNDGRNKSHDRVNGVDVIRKGGTYTVYIWAVIYYLLKLRGKYDVIIDSENGIPFFTPLFIRKPKILLIHHVHSEVFDQYLRFPFSKIAKFLETRLAPRVYRDVSVIAVSNATKKDLTKLGFFETVNIDVVNPGVNLTEFRRAEKTRYPSLIYLGRLKPYKNIDVAINAFAQVIKNYSQAKMFVVGDGECAKELKDLTRELGLFGKVRFFGRVSPRARVRLLAKSWLSVQPSSFEGWGITVIEANACGTPVVASEVSGLKDSVVNGVTGLLVPQKDVDAFAKTINWVFSFPSLRSELSQGAYSWAKNFSWEDSSAKFYEILLRTLPKVYAREISLERFIVREKNI